MHQHDSLKQLLLAINIKSRTIINALTIVLHRCRATPIGTLDQIKVLNSPLKCVNKSCANCQIRYQTSHLKYHTESQGVGGILLDLQYYDAYIEHIAEVLEIPNNWKGSRDFCVCYP